MYVCTSICKTLSHIFLHGDWELEVKLRRKLLLIFEHQMREAFRLVTYVVKRKTKLEFNNTRSQTQARIF